MQYENYTINRVSSGLPFILAQKLPVLKIKKAIARFKQELEEIKNCEIGRPLRYYIAYQEYTVAYNIMRLEELAEECNPFEKTALYNLINEYKNYKLRTYSSLKFKS